MDTEPSQSLCRLSALLSSSPPRYHVGSVDAYPKRGSRGVWRSPATGLPYYVKYTCRYREKWDSQLLSIANIGGKAEIWQMRGIIVKGFIEGFKHAASLKLVMLFIFHRPFHSQLPHADNHPSPKKKSKSRSQP